MSTLTLDDFQVKRTPTIYVRPYSPELFDSVLAFCEQESKEETPASKNMWDANWGNNGATLPYLLKYSDRFSEPKGKMFLLYDGDKIIGCSGVYKSDFNERIALAGVRTWISKRYRNLQLVKNYLLVQHKSWAIQNYCETVAITFNEYNANIVKLFIRGMKTGKRTPHHLFSENMHVLPYPVMIQNTPQTVVYEKLGEVDYCWVGW